jgi:hypothetical protein
MKKLMVIKVETGRFPVANPSIMFGERTNWFSHSVTFSNGEKCLANSVQEAEDWMAKVTTA